jgi:transcriptional/translational regulatory protein YebC/TACO1
LLALGFEAQKAYLGWRPKNPVSLGDAERAEVEAFLQAIDEDDDVQDLYAALG